MQCIVTGSKVVWRDEDGLHVHYGGEVVDAPKEIVKKEKGNLRPVSDIKGGSFPHSNTMLNRSAAKTRAAKISRPKDEVDGQTK